MDIYDKKVRMAIKILDYVLDKGPAGKNKYMEALRVSHIRLEKGYEYNHTWHLVKIILDSE